MSIHTILGAGGAIANGLAGELAQRRQPVRLVSRNPHSPIIDIPSLPDPPVVSVHRADITDPAQALEAIAGSTVVYLCIGLKYDFRIWRDQWPKIMNNTIEACKRTGSKLIFFDNVYMYGKVDGAMTEETPYNPHSRKGDLRARLATQLMSEVRKGNITASIARCADFYGPGAGKTSIPGILVFDRLASNKAPQWMANAKVPHAFTYTDDAVKALALLAFDENAWNQAWHLPTAGDPPTGSAFIRTAAKEMGQAPKYSILPGWMIRLGGLFDRTTAELHEMLYQYKYPYLFDSSKFEKAFGYKPAGYMEGIAATAKAYRTPGTFP